MGTSDSESIAEELTPEAPGPARRANGVAALPPPTKTPMYKASHAARYQRQDMIKKIGEAEGSKLICYVCGKHAQIDRDDIVGFVDLLHNVRKGENIDLLLHTSGGDVDAAEKLICLVQTAVDSGRLRIIVPDYAKSAGTLMALGADGIVMSDSSELGTIDPQIWFDDGRGNSICHSVLSYLDAYKQHSEALTKNPDDTVARIMLEKLDPTTLRKFESVRDRARNFAESQLKLKGKNWSKIASDLMDTTRWPSHGQMIKWQDARQIGLSVEYLPQSDPRWRAFWELYCLLRLAVLKERQKIFESDYASLVFDE